MAILEKTVEVLTMGVILGVINSIKKIREQTKRKKKQGIEEADYRIE